MSTDFALTTKAGDLILDRMVGETDGLYNAGGSASVNEITTDVIDGRVSMNTIVSIGQSFPGSGSVLYSVDFTLAKWASVDGVVQAKIYAHSGTYGTDGVPTGAALAESATTIDCDLLPTTGNQTWHTFLFTGSDQIVLEDGVHYVMTLERTNQTLGTIYVYIISNANTYEGNRSHYITSWESALTDFAFKLDVVAHENVATTSIAGAYSTFDKPYGQTFTGMGKTLYSVNFNLMQASSPDGTVVAKIYAHTGTYGSTGMPTGSALAVSESVDASSLPVSQDWVEFIFTGDDRILLVDSTYYCMTVERVDNTTGYTRVFSENADGSYSGNEFYYTTDWAIFKTNDLAYKLDVLVSGGSFYLALTTTDPGEAGTMTGELSGDGYARAEVEFAAAASGSISNSTLVTFPKATGDWTGVAYAVLMSASTGGDCLARDTISPAILDGDTLEFAIGDIDINQNATYITPWHDTEMLDWLLRGQAMTDKDWYASLHTASPPTTGNEVTFTGYARQLVSSFVSADAYAAPTDGVVTFGPMAGDGVSRSYYAAFWDASSAGNLLFECSVTITALVIEDGDTLTNSTDFLKMWVK